ncbi:MAG: transcriptional regulator [Streptomyces sp.]|nr:transcriptional regulator [Streptomyces sp.]
MNRDPEAWATLGRALTRARQAQGLTQDELAKHAGVSTASVQSAEAGKVPKARMPYTVPAIATALGWSPGSVEAVLAGAEPPGGWKDVPVQALIDAERLETILAGAMVRATDNVTPAEIKKATKIALDEMRRQGWV